LDSVVSNVSKTRGTTYLTNLHVVGS